MVMWLTTLGKKLSVMDWMITEFEAACTYLHNTVLSSLILQTLHHETRVFTMCF